MSAQRIINVVLFWRDRNPVKYGVRVSKMGTIKDLKVRHLLALVPICDRPNALICDDVGQDRLARLVDVGPERLVMAEIYTFRPFKIPDAKPLFDIRSSDLIFAYAWPTPSLFSFRFSLTLLSFSHARAPGTR